MMMIPRIKNEFDLLGEMFADPFFTEHESKIMKTDIKEKTDKYLIGIELPGYQLSICLLLFFGSLYSNRFIFPFLLCH